MAPKATQKAQPSSSSSRAKTNQSPAGNKKRVRVVEGEDQTEAVATGSAARGRARGDVQEKDDKTSTPRVAKRDLRDKAKDLNSIEKFSSKDAPKPTKGALKRSNQQQESEEQSGDEDEEADAEEADEEEIDFLKGFEDSGDEEDSSDEDEDDEESAPFKVEALPKVKGKGGKVVEKQLEGPKADKKKAVSPSLSREPAEVH